MKLTVKKGVKMKYEDQVVYQIYPKSYVDSNGDGIGDIQGIISKLDYIKDLGVDYIWLSPVNKSPQHDNGYDISDYYDIDPMFGTLDDYKQLILEADKRGLKMMLDLVLNHTSDQHEWFQKAVAGEQYYQDFYIWRDQPNEITTYFAKPAWTYNQQVGKYYFHLFDTHQPDLNWENENVRNEIYKMVNFWIDLGVKGFRLDVIDLIGKEPDNYITSKGPNFLKYLRELQANTFQDKLLTVGECWNSTIAEAKAMCTDGLTQVFHFEHLTTTNIDGDKWNQARPDYQQICNVILKWQNEYPLSQNWVLNNHDMPRLISLWLNQEKRYESATLLATLFSLLRGTQYIYQGEEIGMVNTTFKTIEDFNDVESLNEYDKLIKSGLSSDQVLAKLRLVSRDNARVPFNWSNTEDRGFGSPNPWIGFNSDVQNAEDDLNQEQSIYKYYQQIIKFKKDNFEHINQKIDQISCDHDLIVIEKGNLTIVCNMNDQSIKAENQFNGELLISNYQTTCIELQPYEARVYLQQ